MDDDGKLVQRYLAGEIAAFDELVRRHQGPLFNFISRHAPDRTAAEDILQETFVRMLTNIAQYRHRGRLRSWLFRIAHNLAVDEHRRRKTAALVPLEGAAPGVEGTGLPLSERLPAPGGDGPESRAERREKSEAAAAALARLPEAQREVFLLRQSGLTFAEIARIQDCPLNTALGRMHDAIAALRRLLKEES